MTNTCIPNEEKAACISENFFPFQTHPGSILHTHSSPHHLLYVRPSICPVVSLPTALTPCHLDTSLSISNTVRAAANSGKHQSSEETLIPLVCSNSGHFCPLVSPALQALSNLGFSRNGLLSPFAIPWVLSFLTLQFT